MRLDIHHHQQEVLEQLRILQHKVDLLMSAISDLQAKVELNGTVIGSAVVLLKGLKAALDAAIAAGDPAALQALSDQLGAETDSLAAAVVENTPAVTPVIPDAPV
jgi:hypothetical protein